MQQNQQHNQSFFKKLKSRIYDVYFYLVRRPIGLAWDYIRKLTAAGLLFTLIQRYFGTLFTFLFFVGTLINLCKSYAPAIYKPISMFFEVSIFPRVKRFYQVYIGAVVSKIYNFMMRRVFGVKQKTKLYEVPLVLEKFNSLDQVHLATQKNLFAIQKPDLLKKLFINISCDSDLDNANVGECYIAEYAEFVQSFMQHIKDNNPELFTKLNANSDHLDLISKTGGTHKLQATIKKAFADNIPRIVFTTGYVVEKELPPLKTMKRVDVDMIIEFTQAQDGVYLHIYKNSHGEVADGRNAPVTTLEMMGSEFEKGFYKKSTSVYFLETKNRQQALTIKDLQNSRLVDLLSAGRAKDFSVEAKNSYDAYAAEFQKLDIEIMSGKNQIALLEDQNIATTSKIADLRNGTITLTQTERLLRVTLESLQAEIDKNNATIAELKAKEPKLNAKIDYVKSRSALLKWYPGRFVREDFEYGFNNLICEAFQDFSVKRLDPEDIQEHIAEINADRKSNIHWKNFTGWIYNQLFAQANGRKFAAYESFLLFKLEIKLYALDKYFAVYKETGHNAQMHSLLVGACQNLSRLILKYKSENAEPDEQINSRIGLAENKITEVLAHLHNHAVAKAESPKLEDMFYPNGPDFFAPTLLVRNMSKSNLKENPYNHLVQQAKYNADKALLGFDDLLRFCEFKDISSEEKLLMLESFINNLDLRSIKIPTAEADQYQKTELVDIIFKLSNLHAVLCNEVGKDQVRIESSLCSATLAYLITIQATVCYDLKAKRGRLGRMCEILGVEHLRYDLLHAKLLDLNPKYRFRRNEMAEKLQTTFDSLSDRVSDATFAPEDTPSRFNLPAKIKAHFNRVLSGELADLCREFDVSLVKNMFFRTGDEILTYKKVAYCHAAASVYSNSNFKLSEFSNLSQDTLIMTSKLHHEKVNTVDNDFRARNPWQGKLHDSLDYMGPIGNVVTIVSFASEMLGCLAVGIGYLFPIIAPITAKISATFFSCMVASLAIFPVMMTYSLVVSAFFILTGRWYIKFKIDSVVKDIYSENTTGPDLYARTYLASKESLVENNPALNLVAGLPKNEDQNNTATNFVGVHTVQLNGISASRGDNAYIQEVNAIYRATGFGTDPTLDFFTLYNMSSSKIAVMFEVLVRHERYLQNSVFQDIVYANLFNDDVITLQLNRSPVAVVQLYEHMLSRVRALHQEPRNISLCNFYLKVCADLTLHLGNRESADILHVMQILRKTNEIVELNKAIVGRGFGTVENDAIAASLMIPELDHRSNDNNPTLEDYSKLFALGVNLKTKPRLVNGNSYSMWAESLAVREFFIRNQDKIIATMQQAPHDLQLDTIKRVFMNVTNKSANEIKAITGDYPVFTVVLNDDVEYTLNVKTGDLCTKDSVHTLCPAGLFSRAEYKDYFGGDVYTGTLSDSGRIFRFKPDQIEYEIVLEFNSDRDEVLLINREFILDDKKAKYTLIQYDALLDQVPQTILTNPDYEFWFNKETANIIISSKTDGLPVFAVNKNGVRNLQNGQTLLCLKKNKNNKYVNALTKIEPSAYIELWSDKTNPSKPIYKFNLPRLNISFTTSEDGSLIFDQDTDYKLKVEQADGIIQYFDNYIVLQPVAEELGLQHKVLIPKCDSSVDKFDLHGPRFTDRVVACKIDSFIYANKDVVKTASNVRLPLTVAPEFVSAQHCYNYFNYVQTTNQILPENAESYFQLAEIMLHKKDYMRCMQMLREGQVHAEVNASELYWLNMILTSDVNTPEAIGIKAYAVSLLNDRYQVLLSETLKAIMGLEVTSLISHYYRLLHNIPEDYILDLKRQLLLLAKSAALSQHTQNDAGVDIDSRKLNNDLAFAQSKYAQISKLYSEKFNATSSTDEATFYASDSADKAVSKETISIRTTKVCHQYQSRALPVDSVSSDDADEIANFIDQYGIDVSDIEAKDKFGVVDHDNDDSLSDYHQTAEKEFRHELEKGRDKNTVLEQKKTKFIEYLNCEHVQMLRIAIANCDERAIRLETLEAEIIRDLNDMPEELLAKAKLQGQGGIKSALTMEDALSMFAHNDYSSFVEHSEFSDKARISDLHNKIYKYLKAKSFAQFLSRLAKKIEELDSAAPEVREVVLNDIGNIISQKRAYDPDKFPTYLIFECADDKLLRRAQVDYLDILLGKNNDAYHNMLIQMIMGAGKTTAILPIVLFDQADGEHLSMGMVSRELLNTNLRDLSLTANKVFNQEIFELAFDRDIDTDGDYFENLLAKLNAIRKDRDCVITTPESIQSLYLKFVEIGLECKKDRIITQEYIHLRDIIKLLKAKTNLLVDEGDTNLNVRKELNYSVGTAQGLSSVHPDLAGDMVELFDAIYRVAPDILDYTQGNKIFISSEDREDFVKKIVACLFENEESVIFKHFAEIKESGVQINKSELYNYIIDINSPAPDFVNNLAPNEKERVASIRATFAKFLPACLVRQVNEHYGFRNDSSDPYASSIGIPYVAANTPSKRSEYDSMFETICFTIFTLKTQSLNKGTFMKMMQDALSRRRQIIDFQLVRKNNNSDPAFVELKGIEKLLRFATGIEDTLDIEEKHLADLYECCKDSDELKMLALKEYILPLIKIDTSKISANVYDILMMFKAVRAITGTDYNLHTLTPFLMGSGKDLTRGIDGQTVDYIRRNSNQEINYVNLNSDVRDLFSGLDLNRDKVHALIDLGAFCKSKRNHEVALEICKLIHEQGCDHIKQVLFFNTENILCAMSVHEPHTIVEVGSTKPSIVRQKTQTKSVSECFTFYDQSRTTGTDIEQALDACAVVTFKDNKSRDLYQGVMRMRRLSQKQRLQFVMPEDFQSTIRNVDELINFAQHVQVETLLADHLMAVRNQLNGVITKYVFDMLLNTNDLVQLSEEFAWVFELSNNQTVFDQFGQPNSIITIQEHLTSLQDGLLRKWTMSMDALGVSDFDADHSLLKAQMQDIISLACNICEPNVSVTASNNNSDQMTQVERENETESEQEKEVEIQANVHAYRVNDCAMHAEIHFSSLLELTQQENRYGWNNQPKINTITLQSYVNGLDLYSAGKYPLTNQTNKFLISEDASRVLADSNNYAKVMYRKPIITLLHVKKRCQPEVECFVVLAPPQDVNDAIAYYNQNLETYSAEIFTLNGALIYSNSETQKTTYVQPEELRIDLSRKRAIALYSLLEKQLPILRESNVLLLNNNRGLVKELAQRSPATCRQVDLLYNYIRIRAEKEGKMTPATPDGLGEQQNLGSIAQRMFTKFKSSVSPFFT